MAVISLYRHGATAGVPPMKNDHQRAKRGAVGGWSEGSTRRNTQFLYGVREKDLDGVGFAVTLTVRDCPPDSDRWHKLRRQWEKRMTRAGMLRLHWVTEWQRRGVPHMHVAIWWPEEVVSKLGTNGIKEKMHGDWVTLAVEYGAGFRGQRSERITGVVGWFQYVSKHAARGVKHYQRSPENIPPAWLEKTGRMWGKSGHWPVQERVVVYLDDQPDGDRGWYAYRRLCRSWRVADARASADVRRLRLARTMLKANGAALSRVRGLSEWIPGSISVAMLINLAMRGFQIKQEDSQVVRLDSIGSAAEFLQDV